MIILILFTRPSLLTNGFFWSVGDYLTLSLYCAPNEILIARKKPALMKRGQKGGKSAVDFYNSKKAKQKPKADFPPSRGF